MGAWNGWYHVNGNTYGSWLRGDPRGWREWKHHEHVNGDYKHPPAPEDYEDALELSRESMKGDAVKLTPPQRQLAGMSILEMLHWQGIEVIALCMGGYHFHLLGRFGDDEVRNRIGRAKKHATFVLKENGFPGKVWGKRCRALPIHDREHQINVFFYVLNHSKQGAWTWDFKHGLWWMKTGDAGAPPPTEPPIES